MNMRHLLLISLILIAASHSFASERHAMAVNSLADSLIAQAKDSKSPSEKFLLYRQAAETGSPEGEYYLGLCYLDGTGVTADTVKAIECAKKAADKGFAPAKSFLGSCYAHGNGVTKDESMAVELWRQAADEDDVMGIWSIAAAYTQGFGVEKDLDLAEKYLLRGAEKGDTTLQVCLAQLYLYPDSKSNPKEGFKWCSEAARQGSAFGLYEVYRCYNEGLGVEKNHFTAVQHLKQSADKGHIPAVSQLGYHYLDGVGVPKDYKKGFDLSLKAASAGEPNSMYNLGVCYANGLGVTQNLKYAMYWLKRAGELGHEQAIGNYNELYDMGFRPSTPPPATKKAAPKQYLKRKKRNR